MDGPSSTDKMEILSRAGGKTTYWLNSKINEQPTLIYSSQCQINKLYFILFRCTLSYFVVFCFVLFYIIPIFLYCFLFFLIPILFYSILLYSVYLNT